MGIRLKDLPADVQKKILAANPKVKRPPKYGNEKTTIDGHTFGSKLEASLYLRHRSEERAGLITDIERQVPIELVAGIKYVADFRYRVVATGARELSEAKGKATPVWRLKRRLYKEFGENVLRVFERSRKGPREVEVLVPKRVESNRLR